MIRARLAPESDAGHVVIDIRTDHDADSRLWWETTSGEAPPVPDRLDAAAIALTPKAMNFTQDLHLEGAVSWRLIANLEEYVDAWTTWRPDIFRPIAITADEVVDDRGAGAGLLADRGVVAFSGGVDSVYATHANQAGLVGHRSVQVAAAVLVHGFDIPLADDAAFEAARQGSLAMTGELGVPLVTVATNWKQVADPEWQMTFGAAMAAILHLFADRAGTALLAPDAGYARLTVPWGNNPVTSPLLSSGRMRLAQPGASTSRTQKVEAIGALASVRDHIRVCWEGADLGRNCGACEKCVRTKVNFVAAGHGTVPALGPLLPGELRTLTIGSEGSRAITVELLDDTDRLDPQTVADLRWLLDQPLRPH